MGLDPITADAGQRLLELFVEELSQTVNGVVYAASPAAEEHFPSGFLETEVGSALRTRDVCFSHCLFRMMSQKFMFTLRYLRVNARKRP